MTDNALTERRRLAQKVRQICIEVAIAGYENASMSGLCHEGAWEAAVSAMRMVKIEAIVDDFVDLDLSLEP